MAFSYKEGFIRNREAFMIGMPRLRQKRIKEGERIEEKSIKGSILMSARLRSFKKISVLPIVFTYITCNFSSMYLWKKEN